MVGLLLSAEFFMPAVHRKEQGPPSQPRTDSFLWSAVSLFPTDDQNSAATGLRSNNAMFPVVSNKKNKKGLPASMHGACFVSSSRETASIPPTSPRSEVQNIMSSLVSPNRERDCITRYCTRACEMPRLATRQTLRPNRPTNGIFFYFFFKKTLVVLSLQHGSTVRSVCQVLWKILCLFHFCLTQPGVGRHVLSQMIR